MKLINEFKGVVSVLIDTVVGRKAYGDFRISEITMDLSDQEKLSKPMEIMKQAYELFDSGKRSTSSDEFDHDFDDLCEDLITYFYGAPDFGPRVIGEVYALYAGKFGQTSSRLGKMHHDSTQALRYYIDKYATDDQILTLNLGLLGVSEHEDFYQAQMRRVADNAHKKLTPNS